MVQRLAYGALAIAVLVLLFMVDVLIAQESDKLDGLLGDLLRHGSVLPLVFLGLASLGAFELGRLLRAKGTEPNMIFAHVAIAALLLSPWLSAAGWLGASPAAIEGLYWQVAILAAAMIGAGILAVRRRDPAGALRDLGATLVPILYLGFLASFGLQLRCGRDVPGDEGAWLLLIILLVTKATDIGAYFVGSAIGRHKLAPRVSPKKSIEGALGGLLASGLTAVLFAMAGAAQSFSEQRVPEGLSPVWRAFFFGLALSATGQLGDLLESCFKRDAGIKDSGNVIPRFGGILDLIDSPVLALPVAWFLLTAVFNVV
jgi:phosphatidate cytidylyltransferase